MTVEETAAALAAQQPGESWVDARTVGQCLLALLEKIDDLESQLARLRDDTHGDGRPHL